MSVERVSGPAPLHLLMNPDDETRGDDPAPLGDSPTIPDALVALREFSGTGHEESAKAAAVGAATGDGSSGGESRPGQDFAGGDGRREQGADSASTPEEPLGARPVADVTTIDRLWWPAIRC